MERVLMEWHHAVLICLVILFGAYVVKQFGLLQFPQQTIVFNPMQHEHPQYVNQTQLSDLANQLNALLNQLNATIQTYGVKIRIDIPLFPSTVSLTSPGSFDTYVTLWNASEWDWTKIEAIYFEGAGYVSAGGTATVVLRRLDTATNIPDSSLTWTETANTLKRTQNIKQYMNFTGRINGRLDQVSGTFYTRGFRLVIIVKIP